MDRDHQTYATRVAFSGGGCDFNCIVGPHEKQGGRLPTNTVEYKEFRHFISDIGLIDLGFTGPDSLSATTGLGLPESWKGLIGPLLLLIGSSTFLGTLFSTCQGLL